MKSPQETPKNNSGENEIDVANSKLRKLKNKLWPIFLFGIIFLGLVTFWEKIEFVYNKIFVTNPQQNQEVKNNSVLLLTDTIEVADVASPGLEVIENILNPFLRDSLVKILFMDWEQNDFPTRMPKKKIYDHLLDFISRSRESFKIISQLELSDDYPKWRFSIVNKTGSSQIVNQIELLLVNADIWMGNPESRVIESLTEIDVMVPNEFGRYRYRLLEPILVADQDAITVDLKFLSREKKRQGQIIEFPASEKAPFILAIAFTTDENLYAISDFILLDNSLQENRKQFINNLLIE